MSRPDTDVPQKLRAAHRERVETTGLERDPAVERHDPSNIILHRGKYHFWFTEHEKFTSGFTHGYIRPATSEDGFDWTLHETCCGRRTGWTSAPWSSFLIPPPASIAPRTSRTASTPAVSACARAARS